MLAILLLFFPLYYFLANDIYSWVAAPLIANLPTGSTMIATEVASPFVTPFKLSMYSALFLAMPFILHQSRAFISSVSICAKNALRMPLLVSSILLYYLGMMFAYYLVFPIAFKFLRERDAGRRHDDDGHQQIPRLCDRAVPGVRVRIRNSDRHVPGRRDRPHDDTKPRGEATPT